jgi:FlaA1/EpsC-like NDP-sugar epimerase
MKHVDISEYNPFEAVKTNIIGLQSLIDVSIDADVDRFVFTSSDKAAHPANTMGTTKLLGEKLVTAANKYSGSHDIRLASVRFGNVINSSQSVIPVFREQIEEGDPVTLTDSKMNRFFLTYDDVAELVLGAMTHTHTSW